MLSQLYPETEQSRIGANGALHTTTLPVLVTKSLSFSIPLSRRVWSYEPIFVRARKPMPFFVPLVRFWGCSVWPFPSHNTEQLRIGAYGGSRVRTPLPVLFLVASELFSRVCACD